MISQQLLPKNILGLIDAFEQLPGIGPKTAQRLTFYLLRSDRQKTRVLAQAAHELFESLRFCQQCHNFSQHVLCPICSDPRRDRSRVCVVSEPFDVVAFERGSRYGGLYHVLHGVISPLEGVGPEHLSIDQLVRRVSEQQQQVVVEGAVGQSQELEVKIEEVIIATNPTLEGEATALYIAKKLAGFPVACSRLAKGLPTGSDLGYADPMTLASALEGRKPFHHS